MSDLISREELIRVIDHRIKYTKDARKSHTSVFVDGMKDGYARIRSDVRLMPSAEPEQKGKWLEMHCCDNYFGDLQICKCSECGRYDARPYLYYFSRPNFCSWCGADMR